MQVISGGDIRQGTRKGGETEMREGMGGA